MMVIAFHLVGAQANAAAAAAAADVELMEARC
jgi:hypothetical protein